MHQKLVPGSFFNLVNNPKQPLHARNYFKSVLKGDCRKPLKNQLYIFLNPFPFNKQNCQKQKEPGTSEQSLFRLQNKFKKISLLVMYYLTKFYGVIQSRKKFCLKVFSCKLFSAFYSFNILF